MNEDDYRKETRTALTNFVNLLPKWELEMLEEIVVARRNYMASNERKRELRKGD